MTSLIKLIVNLFAIVPTPLNLILLAVVSLPFVKLLLKLFRWLKSIIPFI